MKHQLTTTVVPKWPITSASSLNSTTNYTRWPSGGASIDGSVSYHHTKLWLTIRSWTCCCILILLKTCISREKKETKYFTVEPLVRSFQFLVKLLSDIQESEKLYHCLGSKSIMKFSHSSYDCRKAYQEVISLNTISCVTK